MAWSWSHTQEAYQAVRSQLDRKAYFADKCSEKDREWIETVWAEWVASNWRDNIHHTELDLRKYHVALARAQRQGLSLGYEKLVENIWEWSSELATCTNGGWEAWCCPFGCMSHMLPFTDPEEDDYEGEE